MEVTCPFEGVDQFGVIWDFSACRLPTMDSRLHFRTAEEFGRYPQGVPEGTQEMVTKQQRSEFGYKCDLMGLSIFAHFAHARFRLATCFIIINKVVGHNIRHL